MQLTLSRSTIRSYRTTDASSLTEHVGTASVARFMSEIPHPYTLDHAQAWIAIATSGMPETQFAITVADEVVGGIGLTMAGFHPSDVFAHSAEIGYWLGEKFWGRGIATEALIAVTDWAFTDLRLVRLFASVYAPNTASVRVLVKAGYDFEGRQRARYRKDGRYIDGLMYAKVREPG